MSPRRKKTEDLEEEEFGLEEEELSTRPGEGTGGSHRTGPGAASGLQERRVAFFAIGALLLLASAIALGVAFSQDYYVVDVRVGEQPEDPEADASDRVVNRIALDGYVSKRYDDGSGSPSRSDGDWTEAPIIGIAMRQLAWTGYVGLALVGLALLAGVLHRLGALNVPGPAPVLAISGVVLLLAGLVPFILDIAHHVRVEWIPGRLDLHPSFYTLNADGDNVHDLYMMPLVGFYLHAGAAVGSAVGTLLLFWNEFQRAARSIRGFAVESAERME